MKQLLLCLVHVEFKGLGLERIVFDACLQWAEPLHWKQCCFISTKATRSLGIVVVNQLKINEILFDTFSSHFLIILHQSEFQQMHVFVADLTDARSLWPILCYMTERNVGNTMLCLGAAQCSDCWQMLNWLLILEINSTKWCWTTCSFCHFFSIHCSQHMTHLAQNIFCGNVSSWLFEPLWVCKCNDMHRKTTSILCGTTQIDSCVTNCWNFWNLLLPFPISLLFNDFVFDLFLHFWVLKSDFDCVFCRHIHHLFQLQTSSLSMKWLRTHECHPVCLCWGNAALDLDPNFWFSWLQLVVSMEEIPVRLVSSGTEQFCGIDLVKLKRLQPSMSDLNRNDWHQASVCITAP